MAFDEWMFERVIRDDEVILLRLYSWYPGAITFGVNQSLEKAFDHKQLHDTPAIRRVTGGRALYHDPSELTYAIALNTKNQVIDCLKGTLSETSASIAGILVEFLKRQGMSSEYMKYSSIENARPDFFHQAPCFASHAKYEVMAEKQKIIASAQRRVDGALLQHGSIKINGVVNHPALGGTVADNRLGGNTQQVTEVLFNRYAYDFKMAFDEILKINFDLGTLMKTDEEMILKRSNLIQKKSFAKREIIKQQNVDESL